MFLKIIVVIAICILGLVAVISTRPNDFKMSRSATMSASPEVVFAQVNDLHAWQAWSPWAKLDPTATNSFEGPAAGTGSAMSWAGNNQVGAGKMTIIESHPYDLIRFKLEFLKPFVATNTSEFTFKPEGNQTVVTWSMSGKNNFIAKAVGLFMNCDKMVGDQFEKGLADLKTISQSHESIEIITNSTNKN